MYIYGITHHIYYVGTTHFSMIKIPIKPIVIKTIIHYLPLFFRYLTYVECSCFNNCN